MGLRERVAERQRESAGREQKNECGFQRGAIPEAAPPG
jgi:hypothetical protein